jgi:Flp pilus assembly protein TadG
MTSIKNDRGTVLVFVTLMIVLLMIMVGMGLDSGQLAYTRSTGQAAVDAAALSAVRGLGVPGKNLTDIQNRAMVFNDTNDFTNSKNTKISGSSVTLVEFDWATGNITAAASIATANGVRVAMENKNPYDGAAVNTPIKSPLFLTPLFNLFGIGAQGSQDVSVSAVAVTTTVPAIPIVIWSNQCGDTGVQKNDVFLKLQHPDKKDDDGSENSCWTTFFDCSSGAADIKALFTATGSCSGNSMGGKIGIDSEICQNRGQVNTTLKTAEDFFFTDHPNSWWLVPVIKGSGNCAEKDPTKIVNWAKIYPTEIEKTGNPKYIKAHVVCDPTLPQQVIDTNLCFSNRLVRDKPSGM